jgi:hypothetical protein
MHDLGPDCFDHGNNLNALTKVNSHKCEENTTDNGYDDRWLKRREHDNSCEGEVRDHGSNDKTTTNGRNGRDGETTTNGRDGCDDETTTMRIPSVLTSLVT